MTTVGEDSITRLSEEEQQAVLYWTETIGVPIFPADTRRKGLYINDWSEIDFASIDYKTNLAKGLYDNGIAIRTGKTSKGLYLIVLDFDGWNSVIEWFGSWDNVVEASRRTRIEWHQDKDRIHYFLLANKPIPNRKILIKDTYLEIRCEKQALFAYPSFHKGGNRYDPISTKTIAELTDSQLSRLQAQIDILCEGYMSDEDKRKYIEFLHLDTTILGVSQGRHDATKVIINNYYWKYNGEWLELSDEERFERAWKWHQEHCNPPRSREEFDRLCKWAKDKFRVKRDELHEKIRGERNNTRGGISGCVSYKVTPHESITGTHDNRLVEIRHTWSEDKNGQLIAKEHIVRTFLACKPVRIIKHRNPLSFLEIPQKYTIEFRGSEPSGNFTISHKSLPQVIAQLKQSQALTDKNLDNAMIAQIKGFEQAGLLEENDDLDSTGFFPIGNREIICSNVVLSENIDVEEINTALDFIDVLANTTAYKDRLDLLSHTLLFGLIAPCSFVFKKVKAPWLAWMHNYGSPNASKTSSAKLALALDGYETNDDYIVSMKHVDTLPRMGDTISRTTFPIIADEMELVDKRTGKVNSVITAAIKTAVDQPILRKVLDHNRNSEHVPALSALIMTSNPPPPFEDAALMKRLAVRHFPTNETHYKGSKEAAFYDTEILPNLFKLHVLGKFRNKFVMNNQQIILDKKLTPFEKARIILKAIYEYVGNRQVPEWFNKELEQSQLEESLSDSKEAIISAFESMVIDKTKT
jgi:Bifunctional DNA primase/polymerase, N-terminal